MNKIRIAGGLIFILSISLAFLSNYIATKNGVHDSYLNLMNEQKAFTQEISKSIFYLYKNKKSSSKQLESSTKSFLESMRSQDKTLNRSDSIVSLWNQFYAEVQRFRDQQRVVTAYSPIITEKTVNHIYNMSISLVLELNRLITKENSHYQNMMDRYKEAQYTLFTILILLLIYLFTQLRGVILFIQKFSHTSKRIINESTIQGLEPIEETALKELEMTKNYNYLVKKIDTSINYSTQLVEQTTKSLEEVAKNIEDFMELISTMQEKSSSEMFEREDAVIESLESVMSLRKRLNGLQKELDGLIGSK